MCSFCSSTTSTLHQTAFCIPISSNIYGRCWYFAHTSPCRDVWPDYSKHVTPLQLRYRQDNLQSVSTHVATAVHQRSSQRSGQCSSQCIRRQRNTFRQFRDISRTIGPYSSSSLKPTAPCRSQRAAGLSRLFCCWHLGNTKSDQLWKCCCVMPFLERGGYRDATSSWTSFFSYQGPFLQGPIWGNFGPLTY